MSLLQKWAQAIDDSDVNAMSELLHDDFEFTLHSAGKILSKQDVIDWVASDDIVTSNNRILYDIIIVYIFKNLFNIIGCQRQTNGNIISYYTTL